MKLVLWKFLTKSQKSCVAVCFTGSAYYALHNYGSPGGLHLPKLHVPGQKEIPGGLEDSIALCQAVKEEGVAVADGGAVGAGGEAPGGAAGEAEEAAGEAEEAPGEAEEAPGGATGAAGALLGVDC